MQVLFSFVEVIGNDVHHLIVAASAAGGTVGEPLKFGKGLLNIFKAAAHVQGVQDIEIAYLFAIAYHGVFHN